MIPEATAVGSALAEALRTEREAGDAQVRLIAALDHLRDDGRISQTDVETVTTDAFAQANDW